MPSPPAQHEPTIRNLTQTEIRQHRRARRRQRWAEVIERVVEQGVLAPLAATTAAASTGKRSA